MSGSSMDHHQARRLASVSVDGRLEAPEERDLALHLVSCAECKAFYDEIRRAQTALSQVRTGVPSNDSVERAVVRATTVMQGEADPGPIEHRDAGPGPHHGEGPLVVLPERISIEPDTGPLPLAETDAEVVLPDDEHEPEPIHVFPVSGQVVDADDGGTFSEPDDDLRDELPLPAPVPVTSEPAPEEVPWPVSPDEPHPVTTDIPVQPSPLDDDLLRPEAPRIAPLVAGVIVTLAVGALAWFLVLQGPPADEGRTGDLPSADSLKSRVTGALAGLTALEATYDMKRLGLFPVGRDEQALTYAVSNGSVTGRVAFEAPMNLREERTLEVADATSVTVTTVRTADEIRTFRQAGTEQSFIVRTNPPFGPPDGPLSTPLGIVEETLGSLARLLAQAEEPVVAGSVEVSGRPAVRVRFDVPATEMTRADHVELLVDAETFLPLGAERSLDRVDAEVLGQLFNEEAIEAAFGDNDRIITERFRLADVKIDGVVLPGSFELQPPEGLEAQNVDHFFETVPEAQQADQLPFQPLEPVGLPDGFRAEDTIVFTEDPGSWGPDEAYPPPDGILQTRYSDGAVSIVVSQRLQDDPFDIDEPPVPGEGLPLTVDTEERGGHRLTYVVSPEIPPYVYGFIGDIFVVVSGWTTREELLRVAASLSRTAEEQPGSPSPSPSP